MNTRGHTLLQLLAALFVAIGLAVAWGMVVGWGISLVERTLFRSGDSVREDIVVKLDGTPLIASRSTRNYEDVTYRTLDGQSAASDHERWLLPASLPSAEDPPRLVDLPIGWGQVMSLSDCGHPPVSWYLIRDNQPLGHAYFVGYDEYSKGLVGYIGRDGFQRALPLADQWFDCGRFQLKYGTGIVASQMSLDFGGRPVYYGIAWEEPWPPVFLIDGNKLLEIDVRNRSVRTLHESSGLVSVGTLTSVAPEPPIQGAPPPPDVSKIVHYVVLRTTDHLILLDLPTATKREFVLPEKLRDHYLAAYSLDGEKIMLQWQKPWPTQNDPTHLTWLKPDGTVVRQENVVLAGSGSQIDSQAPWEPMAAAPIPFGWLMAVGAVAPVGLLVEHHATSYREALAQVLAMAWPPLLIVIVVAGISSWWAWRLQQKYRRSATGAWCAFVFLLGMPGLLAYWFEHRRPRLEACAECGQLVPRDRDACAACHSPFPAPPLVGTEIFA